MCPVEPSLPGVDPRHELAASEDLGFPTAGLEAIRSGAEVTLEACSTGYWQNVMLYYDSNSEAVAGYPTFYVSA